MKVMKVIEFHLIIMNKTKNLINTLDNHENHRNPRENYMMLINLSDFHMEFYDFYYFAWFSNGILRLSWLSRFSIGILRF